ncbi:MAG TPA: phosphate acyltransferase PlsX [Spongiibacteraceae bacterium]|nr:phosphate acyltransferase PlsX [Spongiibacteraceae bacterium]
MTRPLRLAIDAMGGDYGLRSSLPAAINSLEKYPQLQVTLVGNAEQILAALPASSPRITIVDAAQVVEMDDRPSRALRQKTQSSMRVAIDLLAQGEVDAAISAGNTGALMAMGLLVLKTLQDIERPAICTTLPTHKGHCLLLDLGANTDCSATQLQQFALLGSSLALSEGVVKPRVALLNIGAESGKGNERVKQAAELLLHDARLNYCGFIEGDALFRGKVDVVVCDGFTGNVALKVSEGTAQFIAAKMRQHFLRNTWTKFSGWFARPVLNALYRELDPQQYNGACLLGLRGIVFKSHGNSTVAGFENTIARAINAVEKNLIELISQQLAHAARGA